MSLPPLRVLLLLLLSWFLLVLLVPGAQSRPATEDTDTGETMLLQLHRWKNTFFLPFFLPGFLLFQTKLKGFLKCKYMEYIHHFTLDKTRKKQNISFTEFNDSKLLICCKFLKRT